MSSDFTVCPYTGLAVPRTTANLEHVIPEAIGGGKPTCIPVYKPLNEAFGRDVDAPFVDSDPVLYLRATREVPGKYDVVPWFSYEIIRKFAGHDVPVTIKIRGKEMKSVPFEKRFPDPSGKGEYQVVCREDHEKAAKELEEIHQKHLDRLKKRGIDPGSVRRQEESDKDEWSYTRPTTQQVEMLANEAGRFLAKIALGISFKQWGEGWVQSVYANALREVIADTRDCADPPLDGIVLDAKKTKEAGEWARFTPFEATADEHECAFIPYDNGVFFHIVIFDFIAARFRVNAPGTFAFPAGFGVNFMQKRGKKGATRTLQAVRPWPPQT